MLDADTKRRIDTARDILVGKVPDPKSQVEQITIALIYKFMDDLDAESEEMGGQRKFFADGFARYGWAKLMQPGLGGHETLNLYAEAITTMPENPGIPPLFREIFNNAYLPYRDPETLRAFLKVIDAFTYDHSERLGDGFEYLLSVLGSQGDAGQFRTPRHIIDFMVAVIDPKKDEVVLDPACGTAGFLISSYKHILAANAGEDGHSQLTPDERGRLADNFKGYDISPDMVRLSLVNMYLHGFAVPHIFEYDTLTSEERWNEYADVVLANPPFMSPKGGIRPHNRFSVQSKRSEVLFVDYMAEHLTPSGRAGIIVPEGIVFQSQNRTSNCARCWLRTTWWPSCPCRRASSTPTQGSRPRFWSWTGCWPERPATSHSSRWKTTASTWAHSAAPPTETTFPKCKPSLAITSAACAPASRWMTSSRPWASSSRKQGSPRAANTTSAATGTGRTTCSSPTFRSYPWVK